MYIKKILASAVFALCLMPLFAQTSNKSSFKIVPLGVLGGIDESNMSAYMAAPQGSNNYVCLDAGTLHYGIEKAVASHVFNLPGNEVLKKYIKAYLISHSHLDHLAGLIINSPEDTAKNIYALPDCINTLKTHYFTWKSWANFADEGEAPALNKYRYQALVPGRLTEIAHTDMQVKAFPLSHSNLTSTAFLLCNKDNYLLYLGDTGCDALEKSRNLRMLWQTVGPLIKMHQLKAIMIEVSFPDEQPDKSLFGHLTPRLLMQEMQVLAGYSGLNALKNFSIVITHLKPPANNIVKIKQELKAENKLGLKLIYPEQGKQLMF
jgi:3',5'-cyclic-nucleotide phosphodiesterase